MLLHLRARNAVAMDHPFGAAIGSRLWNVTFAH
jgi:hypothetical protein